MAIVSKNHNLKYGGIFKVKIKRHYACFYKLGKVVRPYQRAKKLVNLSRLECRPLQSMKRPLDLKNGSGT